MKQYSTSSAIALQRLRFDLILDAVAKETGVPVEAIKGSSRVPHISEARQVACYAARQMFSSSYPDIALMVGKSQHGTVINAIARVKDAIEVEADAAKKFKTSKPRAESIARIMEAVGAKERALNLSTAYAK